MRAALTRQPSTPLVKKRRLEAAEARARRRRETLHANVPSDAGDTALKPSNATSENSSSASVYNPLDPRVATGPLHGMLKGTFANSTPAAASATVLKDVLHGKQHDSKAAPISDLRFADKNLLLDNPTAPRRTPPRASSRLSRSAAAKGLYTHDPAGHRFDDLRPLHALWEQYVQALLQHSRNKEESLLSADLHGCFLRVVRCSLRSHRGVTGIVVRDSSSCINIVTPCNQRICVAKLDATAEWQLGDMIVRMRLSM